MTPEERDQLRELERKEQEDARQKALEARARVEAGKTWTSDELVFAATTRCKCGAGMAYPLDHYEAHAIRAWVCSRLLMEGVPEGTTIGVPPGNMFNPERVDEETGEKIPPKEYDHYSLDFAFWKVREESSINNRSFSTTRPGVNRLWTLSKYHCDACGHEWEIGPHTPYKNFPAGPCANCGNTNGADLSWDSSKGPHISGRHPHVIVTPQQMMAAGDLALP